MCVVCTEEDFYYGVERETFAQIGRWPGQEPTRGQHNAEP